MTFRIERLISEENTIVLRVSGRVHSECMKTIRELIEAETGRIALDLTEVTLANRDAAAVLAAYEFKGVELRNCPPYIRRLIDEEQAGIGRERMGDHE
jgi:anti-anti-sigma regulatory factor